MHITNAIRSEHFLRALDGAGDILRRLDVVHLDRLINEPAALNTTFEILFWTLDASSTYEICCSSAQGRFSLPGPTIGIDKERPNGLDAQGDVGGNDTLFVDEVSDGRVEHGVFARDLPSLL